MGGIAALSLAVLPGVPASAEPGPPEVAGADLVSFTDSGGELRIRFREGGRGGGTGPEALRFTAMSEPAGVVPEDAAFRFLGEPGAPVWSLGGADSGLPAIDTTEVSGDVTLALAGVDGPGAFAAYRLSAWGRPELLLDSDGQRSVVLPHGRRLGGLVWMFGAPGDYRVTLGATAGTARDEVTYRVTVPGREVTAPPTPAPAPPGEPAPIPTGTATRPAGERATTDPGAAA
ncbi:cell wall anchor protein, partial [Actinoplanes sichuanensis]